MRGVRYGGLVFLPPADSDDGSRNSTAVTLPEISVLHKCDKCNDLCFICDYVGCVLVSACSVALSLIQDTAY